MFINIKYYVITIASIFLALGIGIYIGFMLDGQEIFVQQQDSLINELEKKFNQITTENNNLKNQINQLNTQLKTSQNFENLIFPRIVNGQLKNLNIAVIETNSEYLYAGFKSAITKAGGNILNDTIINPDVLSKDSTKQDVIKYAAQNGQKITKDGVVNYVLQKLNDAVSKGENNINDLSFFKNEGIIDMSGNYNSPADIVVLCGGSMEKTNYPEIIDIPLINMLKKSNIPIIGVERSDVVYSYIDHYKKMRLSTVDDVDLIYGKTALILVLKGEPGNFGIKKTATSGLIPEIVNTPQ